jgi:cellulose synthase/poly-beta-1,6-N-acetylglucosamine synthase-like glycosyltransferase
MSRAVVPRTSAPTSIAVVCAYPPDVTFLALAAAAAAVHVVGTWAVAIARAERARRRARAEPQDAGEPGTWPQIGDRLVTVLIPAWNEASLIRACLDALARVVSPRHEVIVIAGGPDGTFEVARDVARSIAGVRVIEQPPHGKNVALNVGMAVARGDVVVVLDADSRVEPGWLEALVSPLGDRIAATTGQWLPARSTAISECELMLELVARRVDGSTTLQGSGSIAVARRAIERIGGFPEDVPVGVDWDLAVRLRAAGFASAYRASAVVRTERPSTLSEHWRNEVRWRRAHLAALVRLARAGLLPRPSLAVGLYLYGLAWISLAFSLATMVGILLGEPGLIGWWLVFVAWLLLRRLSVVFAATAVTRDPRFLRLAPMPALLLVVTFAAIIPATLTLGRVSPHFRGPRRLAQVDRAP